MFELALLASSFEGAASRGGYIALTHGSRLGAGPAATAALASEPASMRSDLRFWRSRACTPNERQRGNRVNVVEATDRLGTFDLDQERVTVFLERKRAR